MPDTTAGKKSRNGDRMLWLIGAFKIAKGLLLVALAAGALKLIGDDVDAEFKEWARALKVDESNHYFRTVVATLTGLDTRKLVWISIGTSFYAGVFFLEGIGLMMRKRWAEWVTVIVTGSFLPLEIYEVVKHDTAVKITVLVINFAIVVYLVIRLCREK